ncbi:hypothetical protein C5167_021832 [Papaver somniferum]|uniref:Uncharacterized protein n=1 Tax=Papaver somniferum TaxID=3469 RepID=A0A4Y7JK01_PAPSO|nr:uncharacterized protein LOC113278013 [Papaver somniferum]RZC60079.1 hypothetical protein C5167_021832 [Papaver somniferum]
MLSLSEMAFGVSRVDQLVPKIPFVSKPVVMEVPGGLTFSKDGGSKVNLQDPEVQRGGTIGLTSKDGLAGVDDGGSHGLKLKDGEVLHDSKHENVEIMNGAPSLKRSHEIKANYKTGQVTKDVGTEANVGAPIDADANNRKPTKDAPAMKKSDDGNYK